jgi:hypothetical protein
MELRYELKIPLDAGQLVNFWPLLSDGTLPSHRTYPDRKVHSIYLDTPDLRDYNDNNAGISKRKKNRLRWYDSDLSHLQFEIKSKWNKLSSKRVVQIPNPKHLSLDDPHDIRKLVETSGGKFERPMMLCAYRPVLEVSYFRQYFILNSGIRMTIDNRIEYRNVSSLLSHSTVSSPVTAVVEFKFPPHLKPYIGQHLKNVPFRLFRHSKYVVGIDTIIKH